ncbi:MAG: threonylcarbamoyl-AMP synthase [Bacteroidales bacterium]|nr:threonylcarbamoyl-AMP synthase [Bacteroidales bacterium]
MDPLIIKEIDRSINLLKKGKVILHPTDTVWGIGCHAFNAKAINKLYNIKQRSESKNMIVMLHDRNELYKYIDNVPAVAYDLMDKTSGALTIIYSNAKDNLKHVRAEDGTVAIRIVNDTFCAPLIKKLGRPMVSTSANFSGDPSPTTFRQIDEGIKESVDFVVNLFQAKLSSSKPSTLIKLEENNSFKVLRM